DPVEEGGRRRESCAAEDRKEANLDQQRFPSEAVERLAGVDEGEIEHVEQGPDRRGRKDASALRQARQDEPREEQTGPGTHAKSLVRGEPVEDARRVAKRYLP